MNDDAMTTACLVVLRQLGGRNVPAKQDVFSKGLKAPIQKAIAAGWVEAAKIETQTTGANGKPKKAKVDVLSLTPAGEAALQAAAHPEALAATARGFYASLEADRQRLRDEILAAVGPSGKTKSDPAKEIAAIAKSIADVSKKFEKLESQLRSGGTDAVLERIDLGFQSLLSRLGAASAAPLPKAAPSLPAAIPAPATEEPTLRSVLKQAYDDLCLLVDFEDRLVPLPRLFHQAKHYLPTLTVAAFHQQLQQMWDERAVELQGINEVRTAAEPDKAIQRGDRLLYFVIWR